MTQRQKKEISGIVIGLVVLVIIFGVSNAFIFTSMQSQILGLNTKYNTLNTTYQNYKNTHGYSDSQYFTLNTQYNTLNAPRLSSLSLSFESIDPSFGDSYLHVFGEVWNVGNSTAYNSKIHVTIYQGNVIAADTDILLGMITSENKSSLDQQVSYSGSTLTSYNYSLTWTP
ncbi:MAG: hypothetical protein QG670_2832 [Thermoproteota archaeon]|nr:hypothetical protein [Thermoproteota archaeon]